MTLFKPTDIAFNLHLLCLLLLLLEIKLTWLTLNLFRKKFKTKINTTKLRYKHFSVRRSDGYAVFTEYAYDSLICYAKLHSFMLTTDERQFTVCCKRAILGVFQTAYNSIQR